MLQSWKDPISAEKLVGPHALFSRPLASKTCQYGASKEVVQLPMFSLSASLLRLIFDCLVDTSSQMENQALPSTLTRREGADTG
jgi:hypothetical protein